MSALSLDVIVFKRSYLYTHYISLVSVVLLIYYFSLSSCVHVLYTHINGSIDKVFGDVKPLEELQQTCKTKLCKELSGTCAAKLCPLELDIEEYHDMAQAIFVVKKHGRRQNAAHIGDFIQVILQKVDCSLCRNKLQADREGGVYKVNANKKILPISATSSTYSFVEPRKPSFAFTRAGVKNWPETTHARSAALATSTNFRASWGKRDL